MEAAGGTQERHGEAGQGRLRVVPFLQQVGHLRGKVAHAKGRGNHDQRASESRVLPCGRPQAAQLMLCPVGLTDLPQGEGPQTARRGGNGIDIGLAEHLAVRSRVSFQP